MEMTATLLKIPAHLDILELRKRASASPAFPVRGQYVYYLFDSDKNLLYVGYTKSLSGRIAGHRSKKEIPFALVSFVEILDSRLEMEGEAIAHFKPPFNSSSKKRTFLIPESCFKYFADWQVFYSAHKLTHFEFCALHEGRIMFLGHELPSRNRYFVTWDAREIDLHKTSLVVRSQLLELVKTFGNPYTVTKETAKGESTTENFL